MRLISFHIERYRVLRDIDINFDRGERKSLNPQQGYALDFLAGVNGTGKSTVLHLLGRLFAQLLTENYFFPIDVTLIYSVGTDDARESRVKVSNIPDEDTPPTNGILRYTVDDGEWQSGKIPSNLLPRNIVIYTTGSESAWLHELSDSDESGSSPTDTIAEDEEVQAYLRELPGHQQSSTVKDESPVDFDRTLLFIRSERLSLVALCGLLASLKYHHDKPDDKPPLQEVIESISLSGLLSFSLRIRSHRSLTPRPQQDVIDELQKIANHRIQQGSDTLLVFDMEQQFENHKQSAQCIFNLYESPIALFQRLNQLYENRPYYDAPLQEVSLFLRRQTDKEPKAGVESEVAMLQLYEWLSDGEQSFLGRMALFALFRASNMLILLDEPEVHFNDVWKREIVNMLDKIMTGYASHALITTHSSIALTDVRPQDILVMQRQEHLTEGENAVKEPTMETLGADPSDILVHIFGTRSATGERSIRFIQRELGERTTPAALNELKQIVAPGYWRYRIQLEVQRLTP